MRGAALIVLVLLFVPMIAFAAPPASPYLPGETLAPDCGPGDVNCTVVPPITASGTPTAGSLAFWDSATTLSEVEGLSWDDAAQELRFYDSGGVEYVGWKAPSTVDTIVWTLPDADGADGTFLSTDGAGILSWSSPDFSDLTLAGEVTGPLDATELADDVVETAQILDSEILNEDISPVAGIAYSKLNLSGSVLATDLASDSVTTEKIEDGAVETENILDGEIVDADISAAAAIAYAKLNLSGSILDTDLAADSVTTGKIEDGAVDGTKIAVGGDTIGDLLYYDGTQWVRLAAGGAGDVLQTNGAASPSWETPFALSDGTSEGNLLRWSGTQWEESADGSALTSLNASQLTSGTVPTGRLSGAYTGISGVGTLSAGTWNADTIGLSYGGTGSTNGSITGSGALSFVSNTTNALTLDSGTTGDINIGTSNAQKNITIGNTTSATALLLLAGTGNIGLEVAGSSTGTVQIGDGGSGSTTPDLFALDVKSSSGDPTGTNGAMYYNADSDTFRCYENDAWRDCDAGLRTATLNDTTTDSLTTSEAEILDGTAPSIAPRSTSSRIWVTGAIRVSPEGLTAETDTFRVRRGSGSCAGTQVGSDLTAVSPAAGNSISIDINFIDSPSTTSSQAYTVCGVSNTGLTPNSVTYLMLTVTEVAASGADLAELYATTDTSIGPGDLVALDPDRAGNVVKTTERGDALTIGVISTLPGLLMDDGVQGPHLVQVALAGRVPVRVSNENGPIEPGDYLSASSEPGVAMKSDRSGPVVGQALSSFSDSETGTVMMIVKNIVFESPTEESEVEEIQEAVCVGSQEDELCLSREEIEALLGLLETPAEEPKESSESWLEEQKNISEIFGLEL